MTKTALRRITKMSKLLEALQDRDNSAKPEMYINLLNSAADEFGLFTTFVEENEKVILDHEFFHDDLASWIEFNKFDKEREYTASYWQDYGKYHLHIKSNIPDDGTNLLEGSYEDYDSVADITNDVEVLIDLGFKITKEGTLFQTNNGGLQL